ncbi:hypothetical protein YC2023_066806 [Brassica napus]
MSDDANVSDYVSVVVNINNVIRPDRISDFQPCQSGNRKYKSSLPLNEEDIFENISLMVVKMNNSTMKVKANITIGNMCFQWNITINYSRVGFKLGLGSMAYNVDKRKLDDKLKHTLEEHLEGSYAIQSKTSMYFSPQRNEFISRPKMNHSLHQLILPLTVKITKLS